MDNTKKIVVAQKAVISNDLGQILTIKRSDAYNRPLTWDLPGGNLEFGEKLEDSILREIQEETGLEVMDLSILGVFQNIDSPDLYRITIGYRAKAKTTSVTLSHEHIDYKWVTPKEFNQLDIYEPHRKLVEQFKISEASS